MQRQTGEISPDHCCKGWGTAVTAAGSAGSCPAGVSLMAGSPAAVLSAVVVSRFIRVRLTRMTPSVGAAGTVARSSKDCEEEQVDMYE